MSTLVIRSARVLTMSGPRPRCAGALRDLGVLENADVLIENGRIAQIGEKLDAEQIIDADGRVLMPAFVDCHTHACWSGSRLDEWEQRLSGADYIEILKAGGGIMATVRAVREASRDELTSALRNRLQSMRSLGTGALEVKSGYGLSTDVELKMLRAITDTGSGEQTALRITPTALIGHAIDPDVPDFIERTIRETLPAIHQEFPGIAIDAYCESGAWSVADTTALMEAARDLGHPIRIHADQFNALGMVPVGVRLGALSIDHLEASTAEDLQILAESATFGVILPCSGFHLDGRYADARRLVDAGGRIALATNYNPGSAPCPSMPMAIALAVRFCGLSPSEAIAAATVNAAALLGLDDTGSIAPGQRADLLLLRHTDERMLAFEFGADHIERVIMGGMIIDSSD